MDGVYSPIPSCQSCLDDEEEQDRIERALSWSVDTCLCGAPCAAGKDLCVACVDRADDSRDLAALVIAGRLPRPHFDLGARALRMGVAR